MRSGPRAPQSSEYLKRQVRGWRGAQQVLQITLTCGCPFKETNPITRPPQLCACPASSWTGATWLVSPNSPTSAARDYTGRGSIAVVGTGPALPPSSSQLVPSSFRKLGAPPTSATPGVSQWPASQGTLPLTSGLIRNSRTNSSREVRLKLSPPSWRWETGDGCGLSANANNKTGTLVTAE